MANKLDKGPIDVAANRFEGDPYLQPAHIRAKPLQASKHSKDGEIMDRVPLAPNVGYRRTPSLFQQVQEAMRIREAMQRDQHLKNLKETILEADDFDVEDESDRMPESPWELGTEPSFNEFIATARQRLQAKMDKEAEEAEALRASASSASPSASKAPSKDASPASTPPSKEAGGST